LKLEVSLLLLKALSALLIVLMCHHMIINFFSFNSGAAFVAINGTAWAFTMRELQN